MTFSGRAIARLRYVAAGIGLGLALAGCSSMGDLPFGPQDNTPPRPTVAPAYLPVHDVPAPRTEGPLDAKAQAKIATELTNVRDRQESGQAAAKPKPSRKHQTSSANSTAN